MTRPRALLIGLVFVVALVIRVAYLVDFGQLPTFGQYTMDPAYHHDAAIAMLTGQTEPGPFFRAPLYLYFLATVYRLFGTGPWGILLAQALLGAASCALATRMTASLFGRTVALVAGLILAVYWPLIYFAGELLVETLAIFLYLCGLTVLVQKRSDLRSGRAWILAGLFIGLGAICRPSILIFVPVPIIGLWFEKHLTTPGTRIRRGLLFLVAIAFCIAPVTAHIVIVGNDFVFIGWYDGINFFIGNNAKSDGSSAVMPGTRAGWRQGRFDAYETASRAVGRPLKPSEFSRYWRSQALRFFVDQPAKAAGLLWTKTRLIVSATERSNNAPLEFRRRMSPFLSLPWLGFGAVFPFAVYGAWRERRRWRRLHVLYGFLITYAIGVVAFFVNARFRLPLVPIMAPFAAAGLVHLLCVLRRPRTRPVVSAVAILAIATFVSQVPVGEQPTAVHEAQGQITLGKAYLVREDAEAALTAFRKAAELSPETPGGRSGQGAALLALGDTAGAVSAYWEEISLYPGDDRAHFALAQISAATGDTSQAIERYRAALRFRPIPKDASEVWLNLGDIYARRGRFAEAVVAYDEALKLNPANTPALVSLGMLHVRMRRLDLAETAFERALEIDPDLREAALMLSRLKGGETPERP